MKETRRATMSAAKLVDPTNGVPAADTLRVQIRESIQRTSLLRHLLRVALHRDRLAATTKRTPSRTRKEVES